MASSAVEVTLSKLQKRGNKGLTVNDCPTGFRLSHYIFVLRNQGCIIDMTWENDTKQGYKRRIGRYRYKGKR